MYEIMLNVFEYEIKTLTLWQKGEKIMDIKALNTTFLDIDSIECNEGQIEGVPSNPRTISEERMEALKKSVEELPDMLSMRELLVYPNGGGRFVAIGGNQRLLVCRELGYTQMPVKIIPQETSAKTLMRIAMLDNEEFGKTDWEKVRIQELLRFLSDSQDVT